MLRCCLIVLLSTCCNKCVHGLESQSRGTCAGARMQACSGPRHPIRLPAEASRRAAQSNHATKRLWDERPLLAYQRPSPLLGPWPLSVRLRAFQGRQLSPQPLTSSVSPFAESSKLFVSGTAATALPLTEVTLFFLVIRRFRQNTCLLRRLKLMLIYHATTTYRHYKGREMCDPPWRDTSLTITQITLSTRHGFMVETVPLSSESCTSSPQVPESQTACLSFRASPYLCYLQIRIPEQRRRTPDSYLSALHHAACQ